MRPVSIILTWGKQLGQRMGQNDIGAYSAALAFNITFALIPLMLFFTALLSFLHLPTNPNLWLRGPFRALLPAAVSQFVRTYGHTVIARQHPALLSIGAAGFLWEMSAAVRQLIDSLNHVFNLPLPRRRPLWRVYLLSLVVGFGIGLLLVVALSLVLVGNRLIYTILQWLWHQPPPHALTTAVHWSLLLAVIWVALTASYALLPDQPRPFRWRNYGTITALCVWIGASLGLSFYVSHFHHLNHLYGSLGGAIILMMYIYLSSFSLLLGAEINAMCEPPHDP